MAPRLAAGSRVDLLVAHTTKQHVSAPRQSLPTLLASSPLPHPFLKWTPYLSPKLMTGKFCDFNERREHI